MRPYTLIDSDAYGDIETLFFPGGEPHCKLPRSYKNERVLFFCKPRTWNDLGIAACVIDALTRSGASLTVFMPYFPGARQDKTDGFNPLTSKMVNDLIGRYCDLITFDLHSEKARDIIGYHQILMPRDLAIPQIEGVAGIIAPDHGALVRATQFQQQFYPHASLIVCDKTRDSQTGWITSYDFPKGNYDFGRYIVVDDICDGGLTFNLLAESFEKVAGKDAKLELFVSHGIFSRGVGALHPRYEHITTTDSWYRGTDPDPRLGVVRLRQLFDRIMGVGEEEV